MVDYYDGVPFDRSITTTGTVTATDIAATNDLTVGNDATVTGLLKVGTGTPVTATSSGDAFVSGYIESGNDIRVAPYYNIAPTGTASAQGSITPQNGWQSPTCMSINTGTAANHVLIMAFGNRAGSYGRAQDTNPTLVGFSQTAAGSATDEWWALTHDVTDPVFSWGKGNLKLTGGLVNFQDATRTASTVTHDAYVTLEIGGTPYKFMLGS